jgi:elongation factor 1-beta
MGQRAVVYSIMPESPQVDLGRLKDDVKKILPKGIELRGTAEKPVAFGLTALHIMIVLDDKTGGTEEFEQALSKIQGIQTVDTVEDTLI